ncbi:MAG: inosine/xanthosine triphosphatase [Phaeodactylibacter sp.]|uniref:inosine/xanthosine triphosphatase n=1 Tax=Phaeodactylibacter sp. TaxID=1940289 RepID=UPI0032EFB4A0
MSEIKVVVASLNPVKQAAVQQAFKKAFPDLRLSITGVDVPSGVRDQPLTDSETLLGARQRAQRAQQAHPHADFWVGLEGGVANAQGLGMQAFGWMCVRTDSREYSARSASFPMPRKVIASIEAGEELGPVMDALFEEHNTKHKGGAVGLLTNGLVSREALYIQPLIFALIPFMHEQLF